MIRIVIFLALASLLALGAAWVADRPGDVTVVWLGRHIETSIMVALVAVMIVVAVAVLLWSLLRAIWRSPHLFGTYLHRRRAVRGDRAITRGLIAVGAGDLRGARKYAAEAGRLKSGEPLALLLNAQAAQLAGDRPAADLAFRTMAERSETKLLGLRGLFVEARRRDDFPAARAFAEEAARTAPNLAWAGQAALEFRCVAGDWDGAMEALARNYKNRMIDKPAYRRQRAVLLTAAALAREEADHEHARELALEAVKLAPSLVPAAELAARLQIEKGKLRRAARIIERAWQINPHPDLAQLYAYLRFGDSPRDRLARIKTLAEKIPDHPEGAIAVARAAIDAHEFTEARAALRPLLERPTQRVAELMAELEQAESGHEGRAREWMARALRAPRDPVWTADGFVSDRWLPVSPVSGRLDAMQWAVPVTALAAGGADLHPDDRPHMIESPPPATMSPPDQDTREIHDDPSEPAPEPAPPAAASPVPSDIAIRRGAATASGDARIEPVIPLVHAPDDPGPDPAAEPETRPEPPADTSWWRVRFFK